MPKKLNVGLGFDIDKLTNSIENVVTGDLFQTEVSVFTARDLAAVTGQRGWEFDWKAEFDNPGREVYKLWIIHNEQVIQGLLSIEIKADHIYMHLLENAPFNRGSRKMYAGVAGNLVAFACKRSFHLGFEGYVSFLSKSKLVAHYEATLDATHVGGRVMIINTESALKLTGKYFKSE